MEETPYYKKCINSKDISKIKEFKYLSVCEREASKTQVCKSMASIKGGSIINNRPPIPNKFIKIVKPTKRLYHGRSVTKSAEVWESSKSFRKIMWWAVEKVTPLMYASTSIKGRSLDRFYRWDVYEAHTKVPTRFLLINKESVKFLMDHYSDIKCEGLTVGKWLKEAFPMKKGKLYRRSHIDTDRKMAVCLCEHIHCAGYIANEIPVADGPGKLHKELLVCNPSDTLVLSRYLGFTTKKGQDSVERYLNEETTRIYPDIVKEFK